MDALALGRSYAIVGSNERTPSTPLVTVESPLKVHVDLDPRTREVQAALKRQYEEDGDGYTEAYATLYLHTKPSGTAATTAAVPGRRSTATSTAWAPCPWCRSSTGRASADAAPSRLGRSGPISVLPLSDAACKIDTDVMILGVSRDAEPLRARLRQGRFR
ncbi:hypothetical protein GCM10011609_87160 [Lentzea pudingi]|uniref:Uncharacterized protein n=1 Tax=Lentzea pudingi TaxID=1789439 RepID=A0ABQ2IT90_9PSEU|nr:hypothetical protein GCM10011609_87160 [Lentzea pudingi]